MDPVCWVWRVRWEFKKQKCDPLTGALEERRGLTSK